MLITSAQHNEFIGQDTGCITATIDGVEMSVPKDPSNRHYAEILKQVADGTLTITEAD